MHIGNYINMMKQTGEDLEKAFRKVGRHHADEPDVEETCMLLASWVQTLVEKLAPFAKKYGEEKNKEPDRLMSTLFKEPQERCPRSFA
jgi:hypothetical protein